MRHANPAAEAPQADATPARTVVFDWDGTLMDSIGNMVDCTLQAFSDLALAPPPPATIRSAIGLGLNEVAEHVLSGWDADTRARIIGRYRTLWMDDYRHRIALFDGVFETLETLAGRGHRMAVATGRGRPGLDYALDVTNTAHFFETTRTVHESPAKPDPQMLVDVLETLRVDAATAWMVGDTTYDLVMARALGVDSIGVLYGSHGRDDLAQHGPVALIERIAELPALLTEAGVGAGGAAP